MAQWRRSRPSPPPPPEARLLSRPTFIPRGNVGIELVESKAVTRKPKLNRQPPKSPANRDHLGQTVMKEEEKDRLEGRGFIPKGSCTLPCTVRPQANLHSGTVVAFSCFFEVGLRFPVHRFVKDLLKAYGIELFHLTPSVFLRLNIFRWVCETILTEEPSVELFLYYFKLSVMMRKSSGNYACYGSICMSYRDPEKKAEYPVMPQSCKNWHGYQKSWFYLKVEDPDIKCSGKPPRNGPGDKPSLKDVHWVETTTLKEKVDKIKQACRMRSGRDMLEEMLMADRLGFMSSKEIGLPNYSETRPANCDMTDIRNTAAHLLGSYTTEEHNECHKVIAVDAVRNIVGQALNIFIPPRKDPATFVSDHSIHPEPSTKRKAYVPLSRCSSEKRFCVEDTYPENNGGVSHLGISPQHSSLNSELYELTTVVEPSHRETDENSHPETEVLTTGDISTAPSISDELELCLNGNALPPSCIGADQSVFPLDMSAGNDHNGRDIVAGLSSPVQVNGRNPCEATFPEESYKNTGLLNDKAHVCLAKVMPPSNVLPPSCIGADQSEFPLDMPAGNDHNGRDTVADLSSPVQVNKQDQCEAKPPEESYKTPGLLMGMAHGCLTKLSHILNDMEKSHLEEVATFTQQLRAGKAESALSLEAQKEKLFLKDEELHKAKNTAREEARRKESYKKTGLLMDMAHGYLTKLSDILNDMEKSRLEEVATFTEQSSAAKAESALALDAQKKAEEKLFLKDEELHNTTAREEAWRKWLEEDRRKWLKDLAAERQHRQLLAVQIQFIEKKIEAQNAYWETCFTDIYAVHGTTIPPAREMPTFSPPAHGLSLLHPSAGLDNEPAVGFGVGQGSTIAPHDDPTPTFRNM